jgi:parallel beta-helix repeat protein
MKPLTGACVTGLIMMWFPWIAAQGVAQVACGDTVVQNTSLDSDLSNCPADGIVIGAPDITLDLRGHTIDGTGVGVGVDNTAGHAEVTIKNGRVREFSTGISLENASDNRLRRLVVSHNSDGIFLLDSDNNLIERSTTSDNTTTGITLTGMGDGSDQNEVEDNSSLDNDFFGIAVENLSDDNRIGKNEASDNDISGILVDATSTGTLIERNVANRNDNDAVNDDDGDGINVGNSATTLRNNTANHNNDLGIEAVAGVIDGGGNTAMNNGNPLQCVNVLC